MALVPVSPIGQRVSVEHHKMPATSHLKNRNPKLYFSTLEKEHRRKQTNAVRENEMIEQSVR